MHDTQIAANLSYAQGRKGVIPFGYIADSTTDLLPGVVDMSIASFNMCCQPLLMSCLMRYYTFNLY